MRMNSIVYKMASRLTIILVILFMVLVTSNVYSLNVVQANYYTSSQNTLNLYHVNIQNYLDNASRDLLEVFETHSETAYNLDHLNETEMYFKSLELKNSLMAKMSHESSSDAMFIKSEKTDFQVFYFGNRISSVNKLDISDALRTNNFSPKSGQNSYHGWNYLLIEDEYYIYKTITFNEITFGTFINANTLFALLNYAQQENVYYYINHLDDTTLAFLSHNQHDVTTNQLHTDMKNNKDYLLTQEVIPSLGTLIAVVEKKQIFSGLQLIQWFIVALGVIAVIVVPFVIRSLSHDIIKPIIELSKAAKEVEKGSTQFNRPSQSYSMEFLKLFHSFHSMVNEIRALKIQAYEEELDKQRLKLDCLQLQIRPHFYLNAISTITSLTYKNKNEEIRTFIQYLSNYLRYMFNRAINLVTIQEEINQVSNYLKMQEIRYPNQIFFMFEIEDGIEHKKIPNFIIQTFIENAFKHAMFYEEVLSLFIRVVRTTRENEPFIYIVIEDNGEGYPQSYLETFINSTQTSLEANYQIGINNIKRTLEIMYKRHDLLFLSNQEHSGAKVEIWIPTSSEQTEGR